MTFDGLCNRCRLGGECVQAGGGRRFQRFVWDQWFWVMYWLDAEIVGGVRDFWITRAYRGSGGVDLDFFSLGILFYC